MYDMPLAPHEIDHLPMVERVRATITAAEEDVERAFQEELDAKLSEHEETKGDAGRDILEVKISHTEELNEIERRVELPRKKDLADDKYDSATTEADDRSEIHDLRARKAEEKKAAAIRAANDLAEADILNTLTHRIGSA